MVSCFILKWLIISKHKKWKVPDLNRKHRAKELWLSFYMRIFIIFRRTSIMYLLEMNHQIYNVLNATISKLMY